MSVMQIGILGVTGALLAVQFKGNKTEYGIYISVGLSLIIFFSVIDRLEIVLHTFHQIGNKIEINPTYTGMLIKMLGITYISEFASGICKDAGYQTIAVQIEIFSKFAILVLGLPAILALLELIGEFLA